MTAQVGTIEIVVPVDAAALTENCNAHLNGQDCPQRATWRVLLACPGCHGTALRVYCDPHTRGMLHREKRGDITKCCRTPLRVTVEAL